MTQLLGPGSLTIAASLAAFFGPIIAVLLPTWLARRRAAIRWVTLTPQSMMDIAEEVSDRLDVTFDGRKITNLTKFTFILHNCGREPIDGEAIVEPLTWKGPGEIIDARVLVSNPFVELRLDRSERNLEIRWQLFNQSCQALIEIISDAGTETDVGDVSGQIRGVPRFYFRSLRYADEEDIRRRVRRSTSQLPKLLQHIQSENMTVYLNRYLAQFFAVYFTMPIALGVYFIGEIWFQFDSIASISIAMAFSASLSILLLFFLRNPYAKLLNMRRNCDRSTRER